MAAPPPIAYLDYNATTPPLPEVTAAVTASLENFGNPSSVHRAGRDARAAVEQARDAVAAMVGATAAQVVFTSGGTESNALALRGIAQATTVLASAVEHPSVLAHAAPENLIPVTDAGIIDLDALESRLKTASAPALIAVMLANNETGAIQPITKIAEIARKYGALIHCDAVQGPGKIAVNFQALGVDTLSLSAHKLGGLKGAGALIARASLELAPVLLGGGQERRRRAGTENVLGIVAFGAAAREEKRLRDGMKSVRALRDALETAIARIPRARIYASAVERLDNTTCVALPGVSSEIQLMRLDLAGVAVSAGAACSSGKIAPSHVLRAMGVPEAEAKCAIRVSLGWNSTTADIDRFLGGWSALASGAAA